jgi:hypothetical protein
MPPTISGVLASGGVLQASSVTAAIAQMAGMNTALIAAGFIQVVASYKFSTAQDIITYSMDNKADVQRGRK